MTIYSSKIKEEFKLTDFLFWMFLGIVFPTVTGNFTLFNILHIFIYLGSVYFVGEKLLNKINVINEIPSLIKIGLFIIFGSIICGIGFLLIPFSPVIYALFIVFIYDIIKNKKIKYSFSFYHFLCVIPFFVILFQTFELEYAIHERYVHWDGDFYYFTAIVESLKTNQSLGSAIFHIGLPINFPALPFFAPAELANFSGISSQFALWGVFMKILPISCLSILAYSVVKIYGLLFTVSDCKDFNNKFPSKLLFTSWLLLFLGPIQFLSLLRLDFKNVLFLGAGYALPIGSPGFAFAMWISGIIILLVLSNVTYSFYYKIVLISLFCFVLYSKIALFLPLAIFCGCVSLLRLFKNKKDLFLTLLATLPCCLLIYRFLIASSDSNIKMKFTIHGYFQGLFLDMSNKFSLSGSDVQKIIVVSSIMILMWLSIKLVIVMISALKLYKTNQTAMQIVIAAIVTVIVSMLPGYFIRVWAENNAGKELYDTSFDMAQFARDGIFLFTIISIIFVLYLLSRYPNAKVRKISKLVLVSWTALIFFSFFSYGLYAKPKFNNQDWYLEVRSDFIKTKPHLMAMLGNISQSGQTLTTAGVHPWYCSGIREDEEGFIFSKAAYDRNYAFRSIFDTSINMQQRKLTADSLFHLGVDCIVASPSSIKKINLAVKDSIISSISGTKWLYRFN